MRWGKRILIGTVIALLTLVLVGYAYYRYTYPFGWSHCCDKGLYMNLLTYAENHQGHFPTGEATPEASLSLLYRENLADANLLRGKSVPLDVVEKILREGKLLGPDTCGWHYVEGLTQSDDRHIAIFWDKEGLGHNGEKLSEGTHIVCFLDCSFEYISGNDWPAFLENQKKLLAERPAYIIAGQPLLSANIRMPNGKLLDEYEGSYRLLRKSIDGMNSFEHETRGKRIKKDSLTWKTSTDLQCNTGIVEFTLIFDDCRSNLVVINMADGVPNPHHFLFKMHPIVDNSDKNEPAEEKSNPAVKQESPK